MPARSGLAMVAAACAGAALIVAPEAGLAAANNGENPIIVQIGDLLSQGYFCFQAVNLQTVCLLGGSIYTCLPDGTCLRAAKKLDRNYKVPAQSGVNKVAP